MSRMFMTVGMVVVVMMVAVIMVVMLAGMLLGALWLKGTHDLRHQATLAPGELGERGVILDV